VRALSLETGGLEPKHDHAVEWGRVLVPDEGVEPRAQDVDQPVGRGFGGVGERERQLEFDRVLQQTTAEFENAAYFGDPRVIKGTSDVGSLP